jgi:hypothetical protein
MRAAPAWDRVAGLGPTNEITEHRTVRDRHSLYMGGVNHSTVVYTVVWRNPVV